jgi:hypothetical protein
LMVLSKVPSVFSPFVIRDVLHRALQTACSDLYTRAKHCASSFPLGWNDPRVTLATQSWQKVGSFQPSSVFCPCPNSSSRTAQPLAPHNLRVTDEVTRTVPDTVNRVFHAPITVASIFAGTE